MCKLCLNFLCYVYAMVGSSDYCWCCNSMKERRTPCISSVRPSLSLKNSVKFIKGFFGLKYFYYASNFYKIIQFIINVKFICVWDHISYIFKMINSSQNYIVNFNFTSYWVWTLKYNFWFLCWHWYQIQKRTYKKLIN